MRQPWERVNAVSTTFGPELGAVGAAELSNASSTLPRREFQDVRCNTAAKHRSQLC